MSADIAVQSQITLATLKTVLYYNTVVEKVYSVFKDTEIKKEMTAIQGMLK